MQNGKLSIIRSKVVFSPSQEVWGLLAFLDCERNLSEWREGISEECPQWDAVIFGWGQMLFSEVRCTANPALFTLTGKRKTNNPQPKQTTKNRNNFFLKCASVIHGLETQMHHVFPLAQEVLKACDSRCHWWVVWNLGLTPAGQDLWSWLMTPS